MRAGYLEDIAMAVARDAKLPQQQLADGAKYVEGEWRTALSVTLFGQERAEEVRRGAAL